MEVLEVTTLATVLEVVVLDQQLVVELVEVVVVDTVIMLPTTVMLVVELGVVTDLLVFMEKDMQTEQMVEIIHLEQVELEMEHLLPTLVVEVEVDTMVLQP